MFDLKNWIMDTIKIMMKEDSELQVRKYSTEWYKNGYLTNEDLTFIEEYYKPQDTILKEPIIEDANDYGSTSNIGNETTNETI